MAEEENKIILYTTDDGKSLVSLMSRDGRVWLNQKQMAELFAVSKPNISMLIVQRSDPQKPNMGLTTWKGGIVRKEDVAVAKNYLSSGELDTLNRITTIFLETAELRVKRHMDLTLSFWVDAVDRMLSANLFEVLHGPGTVSHEKAVVVSSERYEEFDDMRKKEAARLADEEDLAELKRIEEEAKRRNKE